VNHPVPASATTATPFRFSVDQFLALCEQGLFDDYARSELIEGEIVVMNAQFAKHARAKSLLATELNIALRTMGSPLEAWTEVSVRLSEGSLPEPDIVLTSYRGAGVVPVDTVALLIEVADSTLETDLGRKADLYAAAGVPEYWVVDLNENRVLLHAHPRGDGSGYDGQLDAPFGEPLHSATIAGLTVETAGLD